MVAFEWYENLRIATLELFVSGTAVITLRGSLLSEVIDGRNGLLFKPRDTCGLGVKADHLWSHTEQQAHMEAGTVGLRGAIFCGAQLRANSSEFARRLSLKNQSSDNASLCPWHHQSRTLL